MKKIHVNASGSYDILIGHDILNEVGKTISKLFKSRNTAIVTDDIVDALYGDVLRKSLLKAGFNVKTFTFLNGEQSKNINTLTSFYDFLSESGITRTDFIIALGGGVVGDLAGFAAASFLRGIPFVQIPTTLLAQVDSSIGGKTAVNIKAGKNLVGAFHQPSLVICDINTLLTLKPETFNDGMGEVIKYAVAFSKPLFEILEKNDIKEVLDDVILDCINCKKEVVQADEKEAGERMKLNFGHTIGHAIEKHYNYKGITHGQAVAVGIYKITKQSEKLGITKPGSVDRIKKLLEKFKLPVTASITDEQILKNSLNDKKRHSDKMTIVVSPEIGDSKLMTLSIDDYKKFLIGKINT